MPATQTTQTNREAALRRVAIVLSSLPAAVAAKLMNSIDTDSKVAIRRTMATLSDVDPLERQRALQSFKGSLQQPQPANGGRRSDTVDEVSFSGAISRTPSSTVRAANRFESPFPNPSASATAGRSVSTMEMLGDVEDDMLVHILGDEHPQAVALVLASISPAQAARILPQLGADMKSDALSRISRLADVPDEAIEDLSAHLKSRVQQEMERQRKSTGQRALQAILDAMPTDRSQRTPADNTSADNTSADNTSADNTSAGNAPAGNANEPRSQTQPTVQHSPSGDQTQHSQPTGLRVAPETMLPSLAKSNPEPASLAESNLNDSSFGSTDAVHNYLVTLSPRQLCHALGQVDTRQALLTLCGLPSGVSEAAMRVLPKTHAKQVRAQMNSLHSINLREIDQAKASVAEISWKTSRPTAMAA